MTMNQMTTLSALKVYSDLVSALARWMPEINEALEYAKASHSFDDVVRMTMGGKLMMFTYPDAFMLMEVVEYPQFKIWHCFLAGGDKDAITTTEPQHGAIALAMGCKYIGFSGRKGWDHEAAKRGWEYVCTTRYKLATDCLEQQDVHE
jgi:hypothetical protein